MRDVQERGRDLDFVLSQYTNFVKPAFEDFCMPVSRAHPLRLLRADASVVLASRQLMVCFSNAQTKKYADVIIPRGADNEGTSVELCVVLGSLVAYVLCNVQLRTRRADFRV